MPPDRAEALADGQSAPLDTHLATRRDIAGPQRDSVGMKRDIAVLKAGILMLKWTVSGVGGGMPAPIAGMFAPVFRPVGTA